MDVGLQVLETRSNCILQTAGPSTTTATTRAFGTHPSDVTPLRMLETAVPIASTGVPFFPPAAAVSCWDVLLNVERSQSSSKKAIPDCQKISLCLSLTLLLASTKTSCVKFFQKVDLNWTHVEQSYLIWLCLPGGHSLLVPQIFLSKGGIVRPKIQSKIA